MALKRRSDPNFYGCAIHPYDLGLQGLHEQRGCSALNQIPPWGGLGKGVLHRRTETITTLEPSWAVRSTWKILNHDSIDHCIEGYIHFQGCLSGEPLPAPLLSLGRLFC